MKTLAFLLLLLPLTSFSYGPTPQNSCTPLDLRNHTLGPARNQGDISWCYAFTAADMLAHTFKRNTPISAADVAINYNQSAFGRVMSVFIPNDAGKPHETGFNKAALIQAMKDGFCSEEIFPSEIWTKVTAGNEEQVPMPQAMTEIAKLHAMRDQLNVGNLPFYYKFKHVGKTEFLALLKTKKLRNFYNDLRTTVCKSDREESPEKWKVKMVFKNPKIFSRISEQLELGRLVGLDYDSRILESKKHRGVKLLNLHTSPIVGRRWNKEQNTCEFLIRDSYGPQCTSRYDVNYDCEDGHIWLNEDEIYGNMTSIVYMLSAP